MLYKKNMTSYKQLSLSALKDTTVVAARLAITMSYTNRVVY